VALTLVDLGRIPSGPNRFADAADRLAPVLVDEVAPEGNDPGRVAPQLPYLGKADPSFVVAQLAFQLGGVCLTHRDQRRFAGLEGVPQERHRGSEEVIRIAVDQCLVSEA
jgi:hypothetical protein